MRKIILFGILMVLCSCQKSSMWEIENLDGTRDTIEARSYEIFSPDSQFIKFDLSDNLKVIYNRDKVKNIRKIY